MKKKLPLELFKFMGPGLLVTVGFIDPGNWASNIAAGSEFGYSLLWMVTLSTIMLILLQHNAAHLGIASGLCLSEAASKYIRPLISTPLLATGVLAAIATAFAEVLGAAIAMQMLFGIPNEYGAIIAAVVVAFFILSNSYRRIEKLIVAFVSIIGLCFIFEMWLIDVEWGKTFAASVMPEIPSGSLPIIMSVLGAVVMPHNLFLHSEIIQSRHWERENEEVIEKQLKYEFMDTFVSMWIGWAINSAMIIVAAAVFFKVGMKVDDLAQAQEMLRPMLGKAAAIVFALALLFSGLSSSITAALASGTIYAGMVHEAYDPDDWHSRIGSLLALFAGAALVWVVGNPFKGLVYSQIVLSIQLPVTVFLQIYLTSSRTVMGKRVNGLFEKLSLGLIALIVSVLNVLLLIEIYRNW